jgi:hypothetical protein
LNHDLLTHLLYLVQNGLKQSNKISKMQKGSEGQMRKGKIYLADSTDDSRVKL